MPLCPKCLHCRRPGDLVVGDQVVLGLLSAASFNIVRIVAGAKMGLRINGLATRSAIAAAGRSDMMTLVGTAETGVGKRAGSAGTMTRLGVGPPAQRLRRRQNLLQEWN